MKALLVCDIQNLVEYFIKKSGVTNGEFDQFQSAALTTLNHARSHNWKVIHVHHDSKYSSDQNYDPTSATKLQKAINEVLPIAKEEFEKGDHGREFEAPIHGFEPLQNEIVVVRKRASAFVNSNPDLLAILEKDNIRDITLIGAATSGIILSTLRHAADLDFYITIVKEAVIDMDNETHRVLIEKVFPKQATVISVNDI